MATYAVTIKAGSQLFSVNVFADSTVQAIENAKNQTIGRIGNNPRFTIVSVTPFNACGVVPTIINTGNTTQVSRFVATGGQSMDINN